VVFHREKNHLFAQKRWTDQKREVPEKGISGCDPNGESVHHSFAQSQARRKNVVRGEEIFFASPLFLPDLGGGEMGRAIKISSM